MDKRKKKELKTDWTPVPVPQFGGWDHKAGGGNATNYSMVFSQARANRKQHKTQLPHAHARHSIGNDKELIAAKHEQEDQPVPARKQNKTLHFFTCCLGH